MSVASGEAPSGAFSQMNSEPLGKESSAVPSGGAISRRNSDTYSEMYSEANVNVRYVSNGFSGKYLHVCDNLCAVQLLAGISCIY